MPINIGICGAYAIRPYTDRLIRGAYAIRPYTKTQKSAEERVACFIANLILDGYKIHAEKMNHVFIKAENVSRRRDEKKAEEESLPRPLHALIGEIRKL